MKELVIADDLAEQLEAIAERENSSVERLLCSLVEFYMTHHTQPTEATERPTREEALEAFIGMFDDNITDMSTTVRETMEAYYRNKYASPDN